MTNETIQIEHETLFASSEVSKMLNAYHEYANEKPEARDKAYKSLVVRFGTGFFGVMFFYEQVLKNQIEDLARVSRFNVAKAKNIGFVTVKPAYKTEA